MSGGVWRKCSSSPISTNGVFPISAVMSLYIIIVKKMPAKYINWQAEQSHIKVS